MKVLKITTKNLKLLMRSKTSMFVVIFGPLIIMLLVGFAFNNPSASKINIGYYAPDKSNLTLSFVSALVDNPSFVVTEYPNIDACSGVIAQGKSHICIVFPENFKISNNQTNEVIFYVDQSRANFVYAVLDTVNKKIGFASTQLSTLLTNDLLSTIFFTQKTNNENLAKIITLKSNLNDIQNKLSEVDSKLKNVDLSEADVDYSDILDTITEISEDVDTLKNKGMLVVNSGYSLVEDLNGQVNSNATGIVSQFESDIGNYKSQINSTHNLAKKHISDLNDAIDSLDEEITSLNEKITNAKDTTTKSSESLNSISQSIEKIKTDLDTIKASTEKINAQINALKVTSAESIVNPITTRVEPINSKSSNLNFIFPYLVILVIVFISIMLSSTIIIIEKTSKAYFRNFTTPTKDFTFIFSIFLTSLFIVVLQLVLILILAYYFLNTSLLGNIYMTLLILLVSVITFTFLGMVIGYFFSSQEAVTMASISIGSVLLFLSNLVLPLETMSESVQQIAKYNPYVLSSELLKKATLFNADWSILEQEFLILLLFMSVFFVLTLIIQKMSKVQYISKKPIAKQIVKRKEEIIDNYFKLKNGILVRDEKDLLKELQTMSDITFSEYVKNNKNEFAEWFKLTGNSELSRAVSKCKSREETIEAIEKYFKKIK